MSNGARKNKFAERNKRADDAVSMQAIYLMTGAEAARSSMSKPAPGNSCGHLGQAGLMCQFAPLMAAFLEKPEIDTSVMPGVFNYEVTEQMGSWLMWNQQATEVEFMAELDAEFKRFMAQGGA